VIKVVVTLRFADHFAVGTVQLELDQTLVPLSVPITVLKVLWAQVLGFETEEFFTRVNVVLKSKAEVLRLVVVECAF